MRIVARNYRGRKEAYTKALETEIAQSKAREAELLRANERLQGTIKSLVGKLEQLGVDGIDEIIRPNLTEYKREPKPNSMSGRAPPLARLGDVDPVTLGMDFVLA